MKTASLRSLSPSVGISIAFILMSLAIVASVAIVLPRL